MALAHNVMIRYLNSIYLQATGITDPKDVADFLFYCQSWHGIIHEHHAGEEKVFFPRLHALMGEDVMEDAVEEHKAFGAGVEEFHSYVSNTKPEEYDGTKLRSIIDSFAPALLKHLQAEIKKLIDVGEKFGGDKFQVLFDEFEAELMKESRKEWDPVSFDSIVSGLCTNYSAKHVVVPAGIGAVDRTYENGLHASWPPFPWFVPLMSKWIFSRKYSGSWRFSPCYNFKRKELQYVGDDYEQAVAMAVKLLQV
jgi:hypothetical protein